MNDYSRELVTILGIALVLNLILGTVVLVKMLQVLNQIKRITTKAENLTEKVSDLSGFAKNALHGLSIGRVAGSLLNIFRKKRSRKQRRNGDG